MGAGRCPSSMGADWGALENAHSVEFEGRLSAPAAAVARRLRIAAKDKTPPLDPFRSLKKATRFIISSRVHARSSGTMVISPRWAAAAARCNQKGLGIAEMGLATRALAVSLRPRIRPAILSPASRRQVGS